MNLYERQESLGLNVDTSITVVGCGGIGFWVCKMAAMSGIRKIYAYDPDIIEENNLNRLDLPEKFIGRNKADIVKLVINSIRPDCSVYSFPFKLQSHTFGGSEWIVDTCDNHKSQIENQKIAKMNGCKYFKAGYNGFHVSINDVVAEWDAEETPDGYTITPSWVVPSVMIASMAIAKVIKYSNMEMSCDIKDLFVVK